MEIVLLPFQRYATVSGRARRLEFGVFVLVTLAGTAVLTGVDLQVGLIGIGGRTGVLGGLWGLFVLLPGIALSVRRLHDFGASGWWYLLALVPLVNLGLFLFLLLKPGSEGANRFGEDPKRAAV